MKPIPQMEPSYDEAEQKALHEYMASGGWLTEFKKTEEFANAIATFTHSPYCIITNNGTITLSLALMALGVGPGDEVLVPDLTMIATPNSVKLVGAQPILVDIDAKTLCLSLSEAEKKITSKTKALMYVAFNGRSQSMHEVANFAKTNKLLLIEDAAQALGAYSQGQHIGTFGMVGSFSFSVPKIITTGQGGSPGDSEGSRGEEPLGSEESRRRTGGDADPSPVGSLTPLGEKLQDRQRDRVDSCGGGAEMRQGRSLEELLPKTAMARCHPSRHRFSTSNRDSIGSVAGGTSGN